MKFRVSRHLARIDQEMVEVRNDRDELIATIYPHAQGLHVVSKHLTGHADTVGFPGGVLFVLDPDVRDT